MFKNILVRCLFLVAILVLGKNKLNAQSGSSAELPKVVGPSPNVAALQRYGDIPVSPYTGVPDISIPLFQINSGNLSVPISISYHASGIKVSDEASRVGLGWALNAGGVISRTIIGEDDFISNTFGYHATTSTANIPTGPKAAMSRGFNVQKGNISVGGILDLPNLLRDGYNFQPDNYNYNIPGGSGKFFLKRNKEVTLAKKEKIKVSCIGSTADSWEIIGADGTKYLFEEFETFNNNESGGGSPTTSRSAWYLTKIISTKKDTIYFHYLTTTNYIRPTGSFFESINPVVFLANSTQSCGESSLPFPSVTRETPGKDYKNVYLDRIRFKNGWVKFIYGNDRIDVLNDFKLNELQIYSTNNHFDTTLIKKVNLYYSYFSGTAYGWTPASGNDDKVSKRMRLDSVVEIDPLGNRIPPYVFTYKNSTGPSGTESLLPAKTSFRRDHWGYYNGRTNTSLIPEYSINQANEITVHTIGIQGDNRDPDANFNQLFVLQEIKYPTGGKTELEFESHDFDLEKSNVNDHSFFANFPEAVSKTINKLYISPIAGELPTTSDFPNKILDLTDLYTDQNATTSKVDLSAFFRFGQAFSSCSFAPNTVFITLTKEDGTVVSGPTDLATFLGATTPPKTTCVPSGGGTTYIALRFENSYLLTPGKYVWKVSAPSGYELMEDISLTINYSAKKVLQNITNSGETLTGAAFGGGLRIRRIKDFDNVTNVPKVKRFLYHHTDSEGRVFSYGRRMSRPIYSYFDDSYREKDCNPIPVVEVTRSQHLIRESDSNIPLNGSAGGNVVGYDTVIVLNGENGEFGKTEYAFENVPDHIWDYSESDFITDISTTVPRKAPTLGTHSNVSNGNILKQVEYEKVGATYIIVRETINTYTELVAGSNSLWYGIEKRNYNSPPSNILYAFRAYVYPSFLEGRKELSQTILRIYSKDDPTLFLDEQTSYTYNTTSHLQLEKVNRYSSNGELVSTEMTYPMDYSDANSDAAILSMKGARHMHALPIEKRTIITRSDNTTRVVTGLEVFKFGIENDMVLPKSIGVLEAAQPIALSSMPVYNPSLGTYPAGIIPKINFDTYDNMGNILQVHKTNDLNISYLWHGALRNPIAEVMNSSAGAIAYTSFELEGAGNWTGIDPSNIEDVQSAPTGRKVFNLNANGPISSPSISQLQTYIVSYWSTEIASVSGTVGSPKVGRSIDIGGGNIWKYYEHEVTGVSTVVVNSSTRIDELRLYPKGAQMKTYSYDALGMISQCDQNSRTIHYEYDGFGRLRLIRDQDRNILKSFDYKYQQTQQ